MPPRRSTGKGAASAKKTETTKKATAATPAAEEPKGRAKRKAAADVDYADGDEDEVKDEDGSEEEKPVAPTAKKQKTSKGPKASKEKAKDKDDDAMPLADRTAVASLGKAMYIGAHISSAGGVHNSIQNALNIGANAFALFLKSQRKWDNPPLDATIRDQFLSLSKQHAYDPVRHCLPHGSYLVNLAQADDEKAAKSFTNFVDDLKRCDALGIGLYNFHPGSAGTDPKPDAIARIAAQLNKAHEATEKVITVVENMAGAGNVVGSRFEDLRDIIALVEDKSRVGVCIDTCHAFAAGYDMRTPDAFEKTWSEFEKVVGYGYLKGLHVNDSKAPLGSNRDLHANIGTGFLGLRAFHSLVNHAPLAGLPMILETPCERKGKDGKMVEDKGVWAEEIKLLEGLIGVDAEGDEFKEKEKELLKEGAGERKRVQEQVDKKAAKDAKKIKKKGEDGEEAAGSDLTKWLTKGKKK